MDAQLSFLDSMFSEKGNENREQLMFLLSEKIKSKYLRGKLVKGTICPCCSQTMRIYKYSITGEMARVLIFLYRLNKKYPNHEPVHLETVLRKVFGARMPRGNKYPLLRHWGLIARSDVRYSKHLKADVPGCYKITDLGVAFVSVLFGIPANIYMYDNCCLGFSEEQTQITQVIGNKFSLEDALSEEIDFDKIIPVKQ